MGFIGNGGSYWDWKHACHASDLHPSPVRMGENKSVQQGERAVWRFCDAAIRYGGPQYWDGYVSMAVPTAGDLEGAVAEKAEGDLEDCIWVGDWVRSETPRYLGPEKGRKGVHHLESDAIKGKLIITMSILTIGNSPS